MCPQFSVSLPAPSDGRGVLRPGRSQGYPAGQGHLSFCSLSGARLCWTRAPGQQPRPRQVLEKAGYKRGPAPAAPGVCGVWGRPLPAAGAGGRGGGSPSPVCAAPRCAPNPPAAPRGSPAGAPGRSEAAREAGGGGRAGPGRAGRARAGAGAGAQTRRARARGPEGRAPSALCSRQRRPARPKLGGGAVQGSAADQTLVSAGALSPLCKVGAWAGWGHRRPPRLAPAGEPPDSLDQAAVMPDSPAELRTQPRSIPTSSQGALRQPPSTTQPHSDDGPALSLPPGRLHSCLKWSMVCLLMNGGHSPTALSGASATPNGVSSSGAPSSTAPLCTQHLPPTCSARQLCKLKRFLTTLQQFGRDISPEIGARVRSLVLGLVNSSLTIEEFHSRLQEATNFPLRPFVIPFLKANLPGLQRELVHCARLAKQTPAQYLAQHEHLLLDAAAASSPSDSSELLQSPHENGKRKSPDRTKENGSNLEPPAPDHSSKRLCTLSPAQRYSPSNGLPQSMPPPAPHYRLEDMAMAHHFRDSYRHLEPRELREHYQHLGVHGSRTEEVIDHRLTEREWAEEWKHLNNLLNCIMDMAEKTRRSLTVLRRCQEADREELNHWIRRYSDSEDPKKGSPHPPRPLSTSVGVGGPQPAAPRELLHRALSSYMPEEIWRKAEEAVNEVKRQAMSELQKAVEDAERKAHELISTERAKMERALAAARRQASEDALAAVSLQEDSSESCWNCGRKASETCSGCNAARYCGSFCQHKDWEKHHHVCGQSLQGPSAAADGVPGPPDAAATALGSCMPAGASSPGQPSSSEPSCPGSPGPLDAAPH